MICPSLWLLWAALVVLAAWSWLIDRRRWRLVDLAAGAERAAHEAAVSAIAAKTAGDQSERAVKKFSGALFTVAMADEVTKQIPAIEIRLEALEGGAFGARLEALENAVFSGLPTEAKAEVAR